MAHCDRNLAVELVLDFLRTPAETTCRHLAVYDNNIREYWTGRLKLLSKKFARPKVKWMPFKNCECLRCRSGGCVYCNRKSYKWNVGESNFGERRFPLWGICKWRFYESHTNGHYLPVQYRLASLVQPFRFIRWWCNFTKTMFFVFNEDKWNLHSPPPASWRSFWPKSDASGRVRVRPVHTTIRISSWTRRTENGPPPTLRGLCLLLLFPFIESWIFVKVNELCESADC